MVFLSNYLVFKIVLAALGRVDYPVAGDLELKYDNANKIYLSGGSLDYVDDATLYTTIGGETTSHDLSVKSDNFINSKQLFNSNAGEKMATEGWYNRRIWANGDGTRFIVLAQEYGSYGRAYIYEHSGGSWTQVKVYDKPTQSGNRMGLYCIMNRAGNRIWVDANPLLYFWERGSSEWNSTPTQSFNNNNNANRGLGMNEAGTILASCDAFYNSYYGQTIIRYVNSSGNWASTVLNGSSQSHWGWESVLNKEGDILFQGSINNGVKIWHRTDAYGASWSHVHTPASDNSFVSNCKSIAISDTGYSFISGNSDYDSSRGRIYFYSYDGVSNPVQLTFIDGENQNDQFGLGLSMSGDGTVAAVSAHTYPSNANDGRVYVYVKSGGSWSLSQTLDKIQTGEMFGSGVALSNDGKTLFVGASGNDSGGTNAGCVYVFKKDISGFFNLYITDTGKYSVDATIAGLNYKTNEVEVTSLNPGNAVYTNDLKETSEIDHGTATGAGLKSCSVSLDGTRVAFGWSNGKAKVYHLETGVWTLKKEYTEGTYFGTQVCLNDAGTRLFVSDHGDNSNTGKVYVYDYSGSAWGSSETHSWTSPNGSTSDRFGGVNGKGISCNSAGTRLLVVNGYTGSKKAYIFDYTGSSWSAAPTKSWSSGSTWWGSTCALNDAGDRAFIGYQNGLDIFHYDGSNWPTSATKNYTGSDSFGTTFTINGAGTRLLASSYNYSSGAGKTTLYDYVGGSWNTSATQTINGSYGSNSYYGSGINMSRDGKRYLVSAHNAATYFSGSGLVNMMEDTTGSGSFTLKQVFKPDQANENMGSYSFEEGLCLDQKGYTAVIVSAGQEISRIYSSYPIPTLDFDNYNKLSIGNAPTNTSSKLVLGSNVYDIGTLTSDLTIETPGLYRGLVFDTGSNVAYFNKVTVASVSEKVITDGYLSIDTPVTKFTTTKDIESNTKSISYGTWMNFSYRATSGYTRGFITPTSGSNPLSTTQGSFWDLLSYISSPADGIFFRNHQDSQFLSFTRDGGDEVPTFLAYQGRGQGHNNFQHVTIVTEDDNGTYYVTLYVNGDKIAKKNLSANSNYQFAVRNFTMGKVAYGGSSIAPTSFFRPFLYDGTLSDTDVKKVFLGNVPKVSGSGAKLKCYFPEGLTDVSGNGNDLVAYDTATANFTNHRVVTSGVTPNMDNIMTCNPLTGNGEHTMNVYFDNKMFEITAQSRENSASTTGTHFSAANTFDPRKSSNVRGWCTSAVSNYSGFPHYLSVKFPEAKYVSNCFIIEADPNGSVHRTNSNHLVTGFTIDASTDGTSWSTKYTSSSGIGNSGKQFDLTSPGTFQYWRLGITGSSVDYFGIGFWDIISNNFSVDGPSATSLAKFSSDLTSAPTSASTTGTITYSSDGAVHAASSSLIFPFTVDTADTFSVSFIGKGMSTSQTGFIRSTANTNLPEMEGVLAGNTSFWVRPCNYSLQQDRGKSPGYMNNSGWTHYVYTLSPCGYNLYINGVLRLAKLFNSARGGTTGITTFNVNTSNMFNANGILGKFKAYSNVLDYHQVTELYHADTPGISDLLVQPDPITFDTYNKLSLSGLTNPTSKIHVLPTGAESTTTTYDIGSATNIYIESAGTYTAEMKGSDGFALDSNVVGTVTPLPTDYVKIPYIPVDIYTDSSYTRTTTPYTGSDGGTSYLGVKSSFTYNGGAYEISADSCADGSAESATYQPWHAFTSVVSDSTNWQTTYAYYNTANYVRVPSWIKIKIPSAKVAVGFFLRENRNEHINGFTIQGSNNDSDWTDLYTGTTIGMTTGLTGTFSNSTAYQYYRLYVTSLSSSGNNYWRLDAMNIHFFGYVAAPSLTFDTYNKYTFTNADTGSTYKLKYESNTYDLGTISNVYIANPGTYSAEIKGATNFALSSNVVSGSIIEKPYNATSIVSWTNLGTTLTSDTNNITFSGYVDWDTTGTVSTSFDSTNNAIVFGGGNVGLQADFTSLRSDRNSNLWVEYEVYVTSGDMRSMLGIGKSGDGENDWFVWHDYRVYVWGANVGTGWNVPTGQWVKLAWKSDYIGSGNRRVSALLDSGNGYEEIAYHTGAPMGAGSNYLHDTGVLSYIRLFYTADTTGASTIGNKIRNIHIFYDQSDVPTAPPSLTFDTYNKLTLSGLESGSTSNVLFNGNTYSIGTASNVYIENTGTYEAESKGTTTFALTSNVVGAIASKSPVTVAFHFNTFSWGGDPYSDGSVTAAATAGHIYSDTPTGTYTWGSLDSASTASQQTTYTWTPASTVTSKVLMVAGGGGGGNSDNGNGGGGGGGAGGVVYNSSVSLSGQQTIKVGGNNSAVRGDGVSTTFTGLTTAFGGGKGAGSSGGASAGGSGGGAFRNGTGGAGTSGQGYAGGNGSSTYSPWADQGGSGGGGAGGAGADATGPNGANGGIGLDYSSVFGTTYGDSGWFASGGGGGFHSGSPGTASNGGGTSGGATSGSTGATGQKHTGGGGGGGSIASGPGSYGGSGIVLVQIPPASPSLTFDGYKLVVKNITPTSTTLKYGSNTYEIGSATNIYVKDTGAYTAEIGGAADFAFTSNTVSGTIKTVEPVITGGYQFGHALTYDGKLYGWGENSNGELGVGDTTDKTVPTLCTGIPQGEIVSIWKQSIRGQSRWAKTRDGRIWVTGDHDSYCLPGSSSDFTTFTDVSAEFGDYTQTSNNVVWASGSERATQVLMENGDVWSFGDDTSSLGVLGQGASPTSDRTPRKLNVSNITKITYGGDLVLALDSSNVIWMWGRNEVGNSTLGWGPYNVPTNIMSTGTNSLTSLLATDSETVVDIESSYYSMFALTDKGTVYCTGHNASGQLGQGNATAKTSSDGWVKIEYFTSNAITVNKLYVGGGNPHVFADTSDGWYCWGENTTGELGLGDNTDKLSPVKFTGVSNIKKFGVGYLVSYAITEDGKYYAWGRGTNYARGDNTTGDISYPKYISQLPNILAPSFDFDGYDKVFVNDSNDRRLGTLKLVSDPNVPTSKLSSGNPYWNNLVMGFKSGVSDGSGDGIWAYSINHTDMIKYDYALNRWVDLADAQPSFITSDYTATPNQSTGSFVDSSTTKEVFLWNSSGSQFLGKFVNPFYGMSINTKYTKGTTTYDVGSSQIVTVSDPGTYDAQIKSGTDFSLKSATVPATKASGLYTWAFHHGNFDNAYGDGDILTARDNGRFYADTPAYTGDIGTITSNPNINSYTYTVSFKVINQSGTTIYDGTDGSIQFTMTEGVEYDTRTDLSTALDDAIDTALSGGSSDWSSHGFQITSSTGFICHHAGTAKDTHTYTLGTLKVFHSRSGGSVSVLITNPYYNQTTYTFTSASALTANVLMVAGGGSGGSYNTGGGGAGGLVYKQNESISTGTKTIIVGNGGASHAIPSGLRDGLPGKDTTFLTYTAIGGGAHGDGSSDDKTGGSGGAGAGVSSSDALQPSSASGGFGNQGGTNDSDRAGGGGGGAGGAGGNGNRNTTAGYGGIGKYYGNFFGNNYGEKGWFAGGGGGGDSDLHHSATRGIGGKGGGGSGVGTFDTGVHGQSHTGGGGGGSGQSSETAPSTVRGGAGGSGIVLLQTNVATPNVNSEVKVPEPDGFLVFDDNINLISTGPIPGSYSSQTIVNQPLPDGSEGPVFYNSDIYTYVGVGQSNTNQGDGSFQTIESVFMPIETGNYTHIASLMYSDSNLMTLGIDGNNKLIIQHNNNQNHNSVTTLATSDYTMEHGKWHHLVLTTDYLGNAKAYVNGYLVASERWSSMNADKGTAMFYRIGVDNHAERKYMASTSRCYYSELSPKEIMQLASSVGLGPKLEYDGLNTIKILNTEPGSSVKLFTSNVADTSNVFIVADPAAGEYTVPEAGKYYAEIKGSNTFTITKTLDVSGTFPLYQYPPVATGTKSSLTTSLSADTWNTWTMSGASAGNGQYQVKTSHTTNAPGGTNATAAGLFTNGVKIEIISDGGASIYSFLHTSTLSNFDITLQLPSAKIIRKYVLYPADTNAPVSTPGGSVDPTLTGGGEESTRRPKSWTIQGSNDDSSWTTIDTVSNKPPSIYGDVHTISSPASYQYYQLSISENNGSSQFMQLGEWQLWGDA
jgi:alpha-tubulin suppressor-like RCC1 family protein